jgi:glycosyltransferase involved in cell wall biosynthesis
MKILFISPSTMPTYCGVGKFVDKIANFLILDEQEKNQVLNQVLILGQREQKLKSNIEVHNDYKIDLLDLSFKNIFQLISKIKTYKPDIINIQFNSAEMGNRLVLSFLPLIIKILFIKVNIQSTIHEFSSYTIKGKIRFILPCIFSDDIFFSDQNNLNSAVKFFSGIKQKSHLVEIGPQTGTNYFSSKDSFNLVKERINTHKEIFIGFHGLIQPKNDLLYLLNVFNKLISATSQYTSQYKYKLHILGDLKPLIEYGNYREKVVEYQNIIKNFIQENNLHSSIVVYGDIDPTTKQFLDIAHLIDIFIIPDRDGVTTRRSSFWNVFAQSPALCLLSKNGSKSLEEVLEKFTTFDINDTDSLLAQINNFTHDIDQYKSTFDYQDELREHYSPVKAQKRITQQLLSKYSK